MMWSDEEGWGEKKEEDDGERELGKESIKASFIVKEEDNSLDTSVWSTG